MAAGIPARLSAAGGRKFGLTVGTAFLAFGAIALWRGKQRTATVLFTLGGLLVVAALVAPTALGPVERAWMGLALAISKVTTPIFMGIVYFLVILPIGLVRRLTGNSPIVPPVRAASRWDSHVPAVADGERMERQF
jgi:saxitoxin biosynthesis operon SxtJ-like protein